MTGRHLELRPITKIEVSFWKGRLAHQWWISDFCADSFYYTVIVKTFGGWLLLNSRRVFESSSETPDLIKVFRMQAHFHLTQINIM